MSERDVIRLMTWVSPAFPVGAFAYSHGLERAVHDGLVRDGATLQGWLADLLMHGSAWNDAVLLAETWRNAHAGEPVDAAAKLGEALAGSRERHMETMLQGEAFLNAAGPWTQNDLPTAALPYPIALGLVAAQCDVELELAVAAFLHGFVANLVQAAIRIIPLGQSAGLEVLAELEALVLDTAHRAAGSSLGDLGSASFLSDIMAMKHETQYSRLFRS